jgi:hypothetical protein
LFFEILLRDVEARVKSHIEGYRLTFSIDRQSDPVLARQRKWAASPVLVQEKKITGDAGRALI